MQMLLVCVMMMHLKLPSYLPFLQTRLFLSFINLNLYHLFWFTFRHYVLCTGSQAVGEQERIDYDLQIQIDKTLCSQCFSSDTCIYIVSFVRNLIIYSCVI